MATDFVIVRATFVLRGTSVIVRIAGIIWLYGFFALALYAVADTIFGAGSPSWRMTNFLPRLVIYAMWPLAAMTPRGRYLLFRRWRDPQ